MTETERRLREELAAAKFENKVLTWIGAALLFALLLFLGWR